MSEDLSLVYEDAPDEEERARRRRERFERIGRWSLPILTMALTIFIWDRIVVLNEIPHYILPGPGLVFSTLVKDWAILWDALQLTATTTFISLAIAIVSGVCLAVLFSVSPWVEMSFYPFAVILQVTPIIGIAPLIFIYVDSRIAGFLICAWIVSFFPVLSNTTLGLNSADHGLRDLFRVYGASRWQRLRYLQLPAALPYFLGGLRITGGLALIGAVVAEFVAGTGGIGQGLATRILEAGFRLNIPRLFAALILIMALGVAIFALTSFLSWLLLRKWHESAVKRES